jgi:hypothetical protein
MEDLAINFPTCQISSYLCQCFTIASVLSMIVPSKSKSMPSNELTWGGASKDDSSSCIEPIMEGLVVKDAVK